MSVLIIYDGCFYITVMDFNVFNPDFSVSEPTFNRFIFYEYMLFCSLFAYLLHSYDMPLHTHACVFLINHVLCNIGHFYKKNS